MAYELLSPELALVDPELAARARAALPDRVAGPARPQRIAAPRAAAPAEVTAPRRAEGSHHYPLWARVTAALWLVVIGILIGGAAIPHAQDMPRVLPPSEDAPAICKPDKPDVAPTITPGP
jgi:hypothetical protein